MYIKYDNKNKKIISVSNTELKSNDYNIKIYDLDTTETLVLPDQIIIDNDSISLKPLDDVKHDLVKEINEKAEKGILEVLKEWGDTYSEIVTELHNTGMYLETKMSYIFKSELTTTYTLSDIRMLGVNIEYKIKTIDDIISDLQAIGLTSIDEVKDILNRYAYVIYMMDRIEDIWSLVDTFEAELNIYKTITDCNSRYLYYLNEINSILSSIEKYDRTFRIGV